MSYPYIKVWWTLLVCGLGIHRFLYPWKASSFHCPLSEGLQDANRSHLVHIYDFSWLKSKNRKGGRLWKQRVESGVQHHHQIFPLPEPPQFPLLLFPTQFCPLAAPVPLLPPPVLAYLFWLVASAGTTCAGRLQPSYRCFSSTHCQNALYDCLMAASRAAHWNWAAQPSS